MIDDKLTGLALQLENLSLRDAATDQPDEPDLDLDCALSGQSPQEIAAGLYQVLLGRPPEAGSQAAQALANGLAPVLLAVSLLESPEALDLPLARRVYLLQELTKRGLREEWGLPVTGSLVRYLIDPNVALVLSAFRVGLGRSPSSVELAEGRALLRRGMSREQYLRGIWREPGTPSRVCGPVTRSPRGAARLLLRPRRFMAFRQHVLALETALAGQLSAWDPSAEMLTAEPSSATAAGSSLPGQPLSGQVLARVNEVAAGVRRLVGDGEW